MEAAICVQPRPPQQHYSLPFAEVPGKDNGSHSGCQQLDATRTSSAKEDKILFCAVPAI